MSATASTASKEAGALERIAGSAALTALSRIGIPLLLMGSAWGASNLIGIDRRVAVLEQQRHGLTDDLTHRLAALELSDARDRETMTQLRSDVAALLAQQQATLRALDRVERALERREAR
jgi:hypothetical protein